MKKPPVKAERQNVNDSQFVVPEDVKQRVIALWKEDQQALGTSESSAKALGAVLNKIKALCPHTQFNPWLKRHGIDRNRATYCMRVSNGKQVKATKKTTTVPEGFKKSSILLAVPMYERLVLIAQAEDMELTEYASKVVMEHAKAQEKAVAKIKEAILAANRAREEAVEQAKVDKAKAEAKKKADALLAKAQQRAAALLATAQEKAAAATA
jgi:hypothetical protein